MTYNMEILQDKAACIRDMLNFQRVLMGVNVCYNVFDAAQGTARNRR